MSAAETPKYVSRDPQARARQLANLNRMARFSYPVNRDADTVQLPSAAYALWLPPDAPLKICVLIEAVIEARWRRPGGSWE